MSTLTRLVVLSGLAGAGKSAALRGLEDLGYYCVDNLPPALMLTFADLCDRGGVERAALVVDARTHGVLDEFSTVFDELRERGDNVDMVFLDAEDAVLQQRFSETRRPHPMAGAGDVAAGIARERDLMAPIRELANQVIDTSEFTPYELRDFIFKTYGERTNDHAAIRVVSFGFRGGLPKNADLVFDVRFVPNPNYVADLRDLTGMDRAVREYVESRPETQEFLNHVEGLLRFLVPRLAGEGRAYLTLAFGCTGGRHRSVAIASRVAQNLRGMGYDVSVSHRDLPAEGEPQTTAEDKR
ncbi:MAG: RNase adapter RapZ [Acidobacteriota bacterium]